MIDLLDAAREVIDWMRERKHRCCLIGGIAVQRWGRPRQTTDVDITLLTEFGSEELVIGDLVASFRPRLSDTVEFALRNRVVLLVASNDVSVDISLGGLPFEVDIVERSSWYRFPEGIELPTCSAEDLIVLKTFAGRGMDITDVQWIVQRQRDKLDLDLIRSSLGRLAELKEDPDLAHPFEEALRKAERYLGRDGD